MRHIFWPKLRLQAAFPAADLNRIEEAVRDAERGHAAEIRVIVESALAVRRVLRGETPRDRAAELFTTERVSSTAGRTGILVYLLMAERAVEILCDDASKIPAVVLEEWVGKFSHDARESVPPALASIVARIGDYCRTHFPRIDASNELPDKPSLR